MGIGVIVRICAVSFVIVFIVLQIMIGSIKGVCLYWLVRPKRYGCVVFVKKEYVVDKYQARYDAVIRAQQDERRAALIAALKSDKRVSFMDRVKVALVNMRKGK